MFFTYFLLQSTQNNIFLILLKHLYFEIKIKHFDLLDLVAAELHPRNLKHFYGAYFRVG